MTGTWDQAEGGKGGDAQSRYTDTDTGTWRRAQRRVAEADGWKLRRMSRWMDFCSGRGVQERVQERGDTTTNATDGRGDRIEREEKIQINGGNRWGRRVRIKCVISNGA